MGSGSARDGRRAAPRPRWLGARVCAGLALLGLGCGDLPAPGDFQVGASRSEILAAHGAPARKQSLTKTGPAVWGPIEDFWPRVPLGSSVEIWDYPVEGGTLELYFVEGSERVQATGFAPEGAVFEGAP